jgi:regulator of sirC expression with transglutaminase-like and TPR domain
VVLEALVGHVRSVARENAWIDAPPPHFAQLAETHSPRLDLLALAIAAEFGHTDVTGALTRLDALGAELASHPAVAGEEGAVAAQAAAIAWLLGEVHGFAGDTETYDEPRNSMLDRVLERRRGLPILLSVVYAEVARRAELPIVGVGLPSHYVVGHFGSVPPLLLDPFHAGAPIRAQPAAEPHVRPWTAHQTAMRILNNLVGSFVRRRERDAAIRAAELRLLLPCEDGLRAVLEDKLDALRDAGR